MSKQFIISKNLWSPQKSTDKSLSFNTSVHPEFRTNKTFVFFGFGIIFLSTLYHYTCQKLFGEPLMWYIVCVIYWFLQQFRRRRELKECQVLNNREKTVGILSPYFRSRRGFYFTHKILELVINKLKLYSLEN